jgi:hypothetical protein
MKRKGTLRRKCAKILAVNNELTFAINLQININQEEFVYEIPREKLLFKGGVL